MGSKSAALLKTIDAFAATNQKFRDEIRRQTMIYQYGMKRGAAALNGVPPDTYDNMPYAEWSYIRSKYFLDLSSRS